MTASSRQHSVEYEILFCYGIQKLARLLKATSLAKRLASLKISRIFG